MLPSTLPLCLLSRSTPSVFSCISCFWPDPSPSPPPSLGPVRVHLSQNDSQPLCPFRPCLPVGYPNLDADAPHTMRDPGGSPASRISPGMNTQSSKLCLAFVLLSPLLLCLSPFRSPLLPSRPTRDSRVSYLFPPSRGTLSSNLSLLISAQRQPPPCHPRRKRWEVQNTSDAKPQRPDQLAQATE